MPVARCAPAEALRMSARGPRAWPHRIGAIRRAQMSPSGSDDKFDPLCPHMRMTPLISRQVAAGPLPKTDPGVPSGTALREGRTASWRPLLPQRHSRETTQQSTAFLAEKPTRLHEVAKRVG